MRKESKENWFIELHSEDFTIFTYCLLPLDVTCVVLADRSVDWMVMLKLILGK